MQLNECLAKVRKMGSEMRNCFEILGWTFPEKEKISSVTVETKPAKEIVLRHDLALWGYGEVINRIEEGQWDSGTLSQEAKRMTEIYKEIDDCMENCSELQVGIIGEVITARPFSFLCSTLLRLDQRNPRRFDSAMRVSNGC